MEASHDHKNRLMMAATVDAFGYKHGQENLPAEYEIKTYEKKFCSGLMIIIEIITTIA